MARTLTLTVAAAIIASGWHAPASAQQPYPSRPIRMIVPFTTGGGVDIVARAIAQKMSEGLGQSVVIDNRAGAGGNIGIELAARAAPDGYTILIASNAMTISPGIYKSLAYDPVKDFAPIGMTAAMPMVLAANNSLPATSVRELIALGRAQKRSFSCASSGVGNVTHLAMELFKSMTKLDMVHVPYKTTAQKNMDVISGQVDLLFAVLPSVTTQVRAGQMRALAMSGLKRSAAFPDVPTISESGVPGYDLASWNGILAPAGVSAGIVARLNAEIGKALNTADVKTRLAADGAEPAASSPEEFAVYIRSEVAKFARLIAAAGIPKE